MRREANMNQVLTVTVNREEYEVNVPVNRTLLHLLREDLGLIGTKDGCRQGVCGSCTVLVDGTPIRSCLALAVRYQGRHITTVEGLKEKDRLHPLQQAFIDSGAIQCGYCTPGMLMMAASLLEETPEPTEAEVRKALMGNLCRCTGYSGIVQAILNVSAGKKAARQPST